MPQTVARGTVVLNSVRYPTTGTVKVRKISPFASALAQSSQPERSDLSDASSWTLENFWGLGVDRDNGKRPERFSHGEADTSYRDKFGLPILAVTETGTAFNVDNNGYVIYNGSLYAFPKSEGLYVWTDATTTWTAVSGSPTTEMFDACTHGAYAWIAMGSADKTQRFDGTNFTEPSATHVCHRIIRFDDRLLSLYNDATNKWIRIEWSTDLGVTWTTVVDIPSQFSAFGFIEWRNAAGDPTPFVITPDRIWAVDVWAQKAHLFADLGGRGNSAPARNVAIFMGDLYVPTWGGAILRLDTDGNVYQAGPDQDDGLASTRQGNVIWLWAEPDQYLYAVINTGAAAEYSSILKTRPSPSWGWHTEYVHGTVAKSITTMCVAAVSATPRLHWVEGTASAWRCRYKNIPPYQVRPDKWGSATYESSTNFYTPIFNGGFSEFPKIALNCSVVAQGLSTTETVQVYRDINESGSWTTLATWDSTTTNPQKFASGVGLQFNTIQFKLALARGSTNTENVWVLSFVFRYLPMPPIRRSYTVTVLCQDKLEHLAEGKDGVTLVTALDTALALNTLMAFYPDGNTSSTAKYVTPAATSGEEFWSITQHREGQYTIELREVQ